MFQIYEGVITNLKKLFLLKIMKALLLQLVYKIPCGPSESE